MSERSPSPVPRRIRRSPFTLIEVVVAMATLSLVLIGTFTCLRLNHRMQTHYLREQKALFALDNTIERLSVMERLKLEVIQPIAEEEFRRQGLHLERASRLHFESNGPENVLTIRIADPREHTLANVEIELND